MYDNYIGKSEFYELKSLIHQYTDYVDDYKGLTIEQIEERAYNYYTEGRLSSSQYDYICGLIEDLE